MVKRNYILFDLDGTLTDPALGITNSVMYALRKLGAPVEERSFYHRFIGPPLLDSFARYCGFSPEKSREALRLYREYFTDRGIFENTVYEGIPALLRDLQCHVNLIPVNPIKERSFRSFRKDVERFQKELTALGINATIRRTLGSDIQAACGQLRRDADAQRNAVQEST